jgi:hypothetical protein
MAQLYVGKESVSEGIGKRIRRYRPLILLRSRRQGRASVQTDRTSANSRPSAPCLACLDRNQGLEGVKERHGVGHTSGLGLGLDPVAAIARSHGFRFIIFPGAGCVVEIA